MHNNINTCIHVRKKKIVYRFHYPLPPMCETKNLEPFQIDGNYPFSQQYLHTQAKNISPFFKYIKENEDISFSEFLNSLNLDENTYIHVLFICGLQI
jgi:hypothetical protein